MRSIPKIDSNNVVDILPLTPTQRGMLFLLMMEPDINQFFEQQRYTLFGHLDIERIKKAFCYVVKNNEFLRTVFRWKKLENPIQIVLHEHEIPFQEYDLSAEEAGKKELTSDLIDSREWDNKVDITQHPMRITFLKLSEIKYQMIISSHHIIQDGWSNGILLKELLEAYTSLSQDKEPKLKEKTSYKEYIKWYLGQNRTEEETFWKDFLNSYSFVSSDEKNGHNKNIPVNYHSMVLEPSTISGILDYTRNNNVTTAAVLYAVWAVILADETSRTDIVFGITFAGRPSSIEGIHEIIGLFINTVPFRVQIRKNDTMKTVIARVHKDLMRIDRFQHTYTGDIMKYIGAPRVELFDSVVVVQNYPVDKSLHKDNKPLGINLHSSRYATNLDITVGMKILPQNWQLDFCFNKRLYSLESVEEKASKFIKAFHSLVEADKMNTPIMLAFQRNRDVIKNTLDTLREVEF